MSDLARAIPRFVEPQESGQANTRNAQFRELATRRMREALKKLDRVGDLDRMKSAYSEDEALCIVAALRERVDVVERRLMPTNTEFKFE